MKKVKDQDEPILKFTDSLGAEITVDPKHSLFPDSPHQIGISYVTEGSYFYGIRKDKYWKRGSFKNYEGIGVEHEEITRGKQPFILVAEQIDEHPWMDVQPELKPLEPMTISGQTRDWSVFSPFPGMMDFDTAMMIVRKEHYHHSSPKEIIGDVIKECHRRIELEPEAISTIAGWTLGSWVHRAFLAYPYGWFYGMPTTGKTTGLGVIHSMAYHAIFTSGMSNSALFRLVDQSHSTVCYDEAETLFAHPGADTELQERISLFNDGYRAGIKVYRTEKDPETGAFAQIGFDPYSPKFLASVNAIHPTLQQRCLTFVMLKALSEEKSKALADPDLTESIRRRLYGFLFSEGIRIKSDALDKKLNADLMGSYEVKNREWELFKPILLLAKNYYPELLEDHAKVLASQRNYQADEASQSNEAIVLEVLYELANEGVGDAAAFISYQDWRETIQSEYPDLKYITARTLSGMLKKVGLAKLRGYGTGNKKGVKLGENIELLQSIMKRMGILQESTKEPDAKTGGKKIDKDYP